MIKKLFLVFLWAIYWPISAQEVLFPKVLPKNSVAVISCTDIRGLSEDITTTNLLQLIMHPEIQPFVSHGALRQYLNDISSQLQAALDLDLEGIWDTLGGEVTIALTDPLKGFKEPDVAIIIALKDKQNAMKLLQNILNKIPDNKKSYAFDKYNVQYLSGLETSVHTAIVDEHLFVTTSRHLMEKLIKNKQNGGKTLKDNTDFVFDKMKSKNSIFMHVNVEKIANYLFQIEHNQEMRRIIKVLGVADWRYFTANFSVSKAKILTQFRLRIQRKLDIKNKLKNKLNPKNLFKKKFSFRDLLKAKKELEKNNLLLKNLGNTRGLNTLWPSGEWEPSVCKYIPQDSAAFTVISWDIAKLWKEIHSALKEYEENIYYQFQHVLREVEVGFLGFQMKDLVDSLGKSYSFFHFPQPYANSFPQWAMAAKVRDKTKLLNVINSMLYMHGFRLEKRTYNKRILHYAVADGASRAQFNMPELAIGLRVIFGHFSFFFEDNVLVFSRLPQTLMDVIDHKQKGKAEFNIDNIASQKGSFLSYVDWKKIAPPLYNSLLELPTISDDFFHGNTAELPRASTFRSFCSDDIAYVHNKLGIVKGKFHTNFGLEAIGILNVALGIFSNSQNEFENYLKANQKAKQLSQNKKYYEAMYTWNKLTNSYYSNIEYFKKIGESEYKKLKKIYDSTQQNLQNELKISHTHPQLKKWKLTGDWQRQNNILATDNSIKLATYSYNSYNSPEFPTTFSAVVGSQQISDYAISFETRGLKGKLKLGFHLDKNNSGAFIDVNNDFPQNKWTPWKFKVHKNRITYWQGLKHRLVKANRKEGLFGFFIEPGSKIQIRNVQIIVKPKKQQVKKEVPIVAIESYNSSRLLKKGDDGNYYVLLKNLGQVPAEDLMVTFEVSKHMTLNQKQQLTPITLLPNMSKKFHITAKAMEKGSAYFRVFVTYKGLDTKILFKEYTFIEE